MFKFKYFRNLYKRSLPSMPEAEDFGTVYDVYVI